MEITWFLLLANFQSRTNDPLTLDFVGYIYSQQTNRRSSPGTVIWQMSRQIFEYYCGAPRCVCVKSSGGWLWSGYDGLTISSSTQNWENPSMRYSFGQGFIHSARERRNESSRLWELRRASLFHTFSCSAPSLYHHHPFSLYQTQDGTERDACSLGKTVCIAFGYLQD